MFTQIVGSSFFGIPLLDLALVVVVLTVVLRFTTFGYRVRAIGSTRRRPSSAASPSTRCACRLSCSPASSAASPASSAWGTSDRPTANTGPGYDLQAIAAAVIGGTALAGGRATIVGTALCAVLLGVVGTGLAYFRVPIRWNHFTLGAVILLAVTLDSFFPSRRRARQQSP